MIVNSLIITFLAIWLLLTIIYQFPILSFEKFINSRTIVGIIPKWNFFAPTPGIINFHLFYRDQLENESIGNWREIQFSEQKKTYLLALWNPKKRLKKAKFDATISLAQFIEEIHDVNYVKVSIPYLTILNYISHLSASNFVVARQFSLMQTSIDDKKMKLLFLSDLHRI